MRLRPELCPRTPPLEELTVLRPRAVFKGERANWFKPSPNNGGNLLSRDAFCDDCIKLLLRPGFGRGPRCGSLQIKVE